MKFILFNEKGNLAVALVLAVVGIMSGLTMSSLAMRDVVSSQHNYEGIQSLHLIRAESQRIHKLIERDNTGNPTMMPMIKREVEIASTNMKKTIRLESKVKALDTTGLGGGFSSNGYNIVTRATAVRGIRGIKNDSIVRRYGEYTLLKRSFSEFHYFTDNEESTNSTPVYFWGPDEITGRVHSNTDIWLKQAGGGNNGGWPLFHDLVSTAGEIKPFSGTIPYEQVFLGGYTEFYHTYDYPPVANNIRDNGVKLDTEGTEPCIFLITGMGATYTNTRGILTDRRDSATVFKNYPPPVAADSLFRNIFNVVDTVWIAQPSGVNRRSIFSFNKMWLRGQFMGNQTWGCADTLSLIGDILLLGTNPGEAPDDPNSYNPRDYVGIVSEKSIMIKYGHRDPVDSLRYYPNCGTDADGIFIYAAMCALGDGETAHQDGVFSYEYQHPHPSTPAYRHNNVLYKWIDIHRRRYPPTIGTQWPALPTGSTVVPRPGLDFPWYNPLWPERQPYLERGSINLWGTVAQRRRGFVHRSVYDTEYPSNNTWNIPIDFCGPTSQQNWTEAIVAGGPTFQFNTRNVTGATGSGTGYKKNYHFDNRFKRTSPNDFPDVNIRGGSTPLRGERWVIKKPPTNL